MWQTRSLPATAKQQEMDENKLTELRHLVEYQYGETLARRTWLTATEGLPEIVEHLEPLLASLRAYSWEYKSCYHPHAPARQIPPLRRRLLE